MGTSSLDRQHFFIGGEWVKPVSDRTFTLVDASTEETLATKRAELVSWLRASRKGWDENFKDPNLWPPKWADTWFAGTGRTIENEVFFNNAQQPLMESPAGYMAMTEEGIEANLRALSEVGINGTRDMFDTTLLEES